MRAYILEDHNTPPRLAEIATPVPGPGQILVKIAACGLNFADLLMVDGKYQDTPPPPLPWGWSLPALLWAMGRG